MKTPMGMDIIIGALLLNFGISILLVLNLDEIFSGNSANPFLAITQIVVGIASGVLLYKHYKELR